MSGPIENNASYHNTPFYLQTDAEGGFSSAVAYKVISEKLYGAFYGYAGGGEYDGGFFTLDIISQDFAVLTYDDAEASDEAQLFDELMQLCGGVSDDEDPEQLSTVGAKLTENGKANDDGEIVVMLNNFDGDSIAEVSESWAISLRFIA